MMKLVDELKEDREAVANSLEDAYASVEELRAKLDDLDRAIAALEPAPEATALYASRKVARGELAEQANRLRTFLARGDVRSHIAAARERKRLEAIAKAEQSEADRLLRALTAEAHRTSRLAKVDAGFFGAPRFVRGL